MGNVRDKKAATISGEKSENRKNDLGLKWVEVEDFGPKTGGNEAYRFRLRNGTVFLYKNHYTKIKKSKKIKHMKI